MDPSSRTFAIAWRLTLWLVGLLVALMFGMLSAYVIGTTLYIGSRVYTRMRRLASSPHQLGAGEPL